MSESTERSAARSSGRKWAVLAVSSALIFTVYLMQYQIGALAFILVPLYGLSTVQLSNLIFAPMMIGALGGIPLGMLSDRFGVRRVVGLSLALSVAGAILRSLAADYTMLAAGSYLIGFAPAALNSGVVRLFSAWFEDRTSFAVGVYYSCSGLGATAAMISSALVSNEFVAFAGVSAALVAIMSLWWLLVRDAPAHACSQADRLQVGPVRGTLRNLGVACSSATVWCIAVITGLGLASKTAYLGFMPQALAGAVSSQDANFLASFITYGGVLGCVLGPIICARRKHPKAFIVACAIATSALMCVTAFTLSTSSIALLFLTGVVSSITAPIVESIPSAVPTLRACVGSAGGVIGSISLAISYFVPLLITCMSGDSYMMIVLLTGGSFLLAIPFMLALPGVTPASIREKFADREKR